MEENEYELWYGTYCDTTPVQDSKIMKGLTPACEQVCNGLFHSRRKRGSDWLSAECPKHNSDSNILSHAIGVPLLTAENFQQI